MVLNYMYGIVLTYLLLSVNHLLSVDLKMKFLFQICMNFFTNGRYF